MSWEAVCIVLVAALMHAAWNAFIKIGDDRLVTMGIVNGTRWLICCVGIAFVPIPAAASWPFLVLSAVIHLGYYLVLLAAYRAGDLSQVYPLARGASPLLILLGAFLFAGEALSVQQLIGVTLVCFGIVSLASKALIGSNTNPTAVGFALLTGITIAGYSVADGIGVRRSEDVIAYVLWLSVLDGWPMLAIAAARRGRSLAQAVVKTWRLATVGGALQLSAYGLVIWAMSFAPMAAVSALRETSVLFAALIGTMLLREGHIGGRIAAAALVVAGIAVMNIAN